MSTRAPSGVRVRPYAYENFQGLDVSRDITSLDTGSEQHLAKLDNAHCDWRGQIVRDSSARKRGGDHPVRHLDFYAQGGVFWIEETGNQLSFNSDRDHSLQDVYPINAIPSSTVFNQRVQVFARALPAYRYDGILWTRNSSPALDKLRPSFGTSIQRRLIVSGIPGKETQVHISRVDHDQIFPDDEDKESENVLRAAYLDVANLLGSAGAITGIAGFEQNRMAVFTADKALLYRIDPDINNWVLDDRANINVGCVSHNTIKNAGTDVLFCSRSGINSIRRSEDNGIIVYSYSYSEKVDLLYRELVASVPNPQLISAAWDQDNSQYHVFFPQSGGVFSKRLTLSLNPEGGQPQPKFSTGTFLNARCGATLAGDYVLGTPGGVYEVCACNVEGAVTPGLEVVTPMLWHGNLNETKETYSLIIQATGQGTLQVDAIDEQGRAFGSLDIEINDTPDDNRFIDVPLSRQYERKWEHRYRGAQYRFRVKDSAGLIRIIGFAVTVRQ
jgi:hypothetical protein